MTRIAGALTFLLVVMVRANRPVPDVSRARLAALRADAQPIVSEPPRSRGFPAVASTRPRGRPGVSERVGRSLRRLARRPAHPSGAAADRVVGRVVLLGVVSSAMGGPVVGLAVLLAGWCTVAARRRSARRKGESSVSDELPDIVDLLRLATAAGLNLRLSVEAVARHGHGQVATTMGVASSRCARGDRTVDALGAVAAIGEPVRPLVDALLATERYGTPLAPALDRLADGCRQQRRRRHEEAARAAPVKLLFPLVFCTLPALGLLTVVPVLVRSWPSLAS
jgi:tight adherence protein C